MSSAIDVAALAARTEAAARRLQPHLHRTSLTRSPFYSAATGCDAFLKMESEQVTGSFKARGATNKVLRLSEEAPEALAAGLFSASSGNHALAFTHALKAARASGALPHDVIAQIFVPETAAPSKLEHLRLHGVPIVQFGTDVEQTETRAHAVADAAAGVFVSPYNDEDIVAGQGTVALEMLQQQPALDAIFVSVGGGGLLAGIAGYVKHSKPSCLVVACSPAESACMQHSVAAGRLLGEGEFRNADTLSDGTAGGIEAGAITFPTCAALVDEWVSVSEAEVATAIYECLAHEHRVAEGAAAVAVAGMVKLAPKLRAERGCRTLAAVLCGCNIGAGVLAEIVRSQEAGQA